MAKPIVVSHFICDSCKTPIVDCMEGFHVQGNITFADPNIGKGLIGGGTWLNKVNGGEKIFWDDVPESVMCKLCFCKALGIYLGMLR